MYWYPLLSINMQLLICYAVLTGIYTHHALEHRPEIPWVGETTGKSDVVYVHGVLKQQGLRIVNPCLVDARGNGHTIGLVEDSSQIVGITMQSFG